jgi:cytochrome c biogenesis protein CcmG/thiol:disulfide interchange protein DsbE
MTALRRAGILIGILTLPMAANFALAAAPTVGDTAPQFHAVTFGGTRLSLEDFKGQVLVINFWPLGCAQCRVELPILDSYYQVQKSVGLQVVVVAPDYFSRRRGLQRAASAVKISLVEQFRGDYPVLEGRPTHYVIDRAGVLRYANSGALTLEDLNRILVPLLRESSPAPEQQTQGRPHLAMRAAGQQLP